MNKIKTTYYIQKRDVLGLINKTKDRIFHVAFLKKNGELRRMKCRLGVKKHLKGGRLSFKPKEYNLLVVFDMDKGGYRMVNLDTIMSISMKGVEYNVTD